jgi:hypothetical protein
VAASAPSRLENRLTRRSAVQLWRPAWVAHTLPGDPQHVFDANIFHPHTRTLAYSDAMLFQALVAAPWLWAHVNAVLVYNLLLLGGIAASGIGTYVLVRHLTGDFDAALVSAVVFTLLPSRVEHFMHLELQWTVWMPLALWAAYRAYEEGSVRWGAATGVLLLLQAISSLYYPDDWSRLLERARRRNDLIPIGRFRDWVADTHLFELKEQASRSAGRDPFAGP